MTSLRGGRPGGLNRRWQTKRRCWYITILRWRCCKFIAKQEFNEVGMRKEHHPLLHTRIRTGQQLENLLIESLDPNSLWQVTRWYIAKLTGQISWRRFSIFLGIIIIIRKAFNLICFIPTDLVASIPRILLPDPWKHENMSSFSDITHQAWFHSLNLHDNGLSLHFLMPITLHLFHPLTLKGHSLRRARPWIWCYTWFRW